jgi:hypothetical protein
MTPEVVAALIGVGGAAAGAAISPIARHLAGSRSKVASGGHSVVGTWRSSWGPMESATVEHHEVLIIESQRGTVVRGRITYDAEPNRVWIIEGHYNGQFLQLMYMPSPDAPDRDFIDYGCYFMSRGADSVFKGYSVGFGKYEYHPTETLSADYHEMRRIS